MAIWREGVTGLLADNTVDMTLRLDDARASSHMPTATTATATDASSGVIEEDGAGQPSNQERRSSGPANGVHFNS